MTETRTATGDLIAHAPAVPAELVTRPVFLDATTTPKYSDADWQLDPDTIERLVASVPDSTKRAYRYAINEFAEWCSTAGRVALPATAPTLTAYVDYMSEMLDRAPATIEQAIGVIRSWHKRNGHPNQPDTTQALDLLRGYKRRRAVDGIGQRQAVPFTKLSLHACIETLDKRTLEGRRDHVVLVFGFLMMARRQVISALRFGDITETPNGLDVHVRTDKTDKKSEGRLCSLPPQSHPDGDPVRVAAAWRDQLAEARFPTDGPFVCRFAKGFRSSRGPLSGDAINNIVKSTAKAADLPDWQRYSAHSLRAGGLTDALMRGVAPGIAARHGGWDPESPMLGRYARLANRWRDNAMQGAL